MKKNIFLIMGLFCFLKANSTSDFSFEQSSAQAFYFFNQILINGQLIESDDWVVAYKNDICVGSRQWDLSQCGGGVCDVPVMGDDGTIGTSGYMLSNEIPDFKVFDSSEAVLIDMDYYDYYPNIVNMEWSNLNIVSMSKLINQDYNFVSAPEFEHTASMSAVFNNEEYSMSVGDILVGYNNQELVSISTAVENSIAGGSIFLSSIFLDNPIDGLYFEYYNHENKLIFNIDQKFDININDNLGNALEPVVLTIEGDSLNMEKNGVVNKYDLLKAYPNPFNPVVNIDLELLDNDYIEISILDINGSEIEEVFNGYKIAGKHNYIWDASEFQSGIYFINTRKTGGDNVLVEKICLIK